MTTFKPFIKAVGTGKKGNRDLSYQESIEAMNAILDQSIPKELAAAFLVGWRLKEETLVELQGAFSALIAHKSALPPIKKNSIELSYPMNGKTKNLPLVLFFAQRFPEIDFHIAYSKQGSNPLSFFALQEAGLLQENIKLHDRALFLPKLEQLHDFREHLMLRTALNTLEKLHDIADGAYAIIGAHHAPYFKKYAAIFAPYYKKLMIVQGNEGSSDMYGKGRVHLIEQGDLVSNELLSPSLKLPKSAQALSLDSLITQLEKPDSALQSIIDFNSRLIEKLIS